MINNFKQTTGGMEMTRQKILTSFITFLLVLLTIASANAQGTNEAYWVDASTNTRLDNLVLPVGEERLITLKAEVPANKTLRAYDLGIIYDNTRVSVIIENDPENIFTLTTNHDIPGSVKVNAIELSGVGAEGVAPLITLRVNGLSELPSSFAVFITLFGYNKTEQFIPDVVPLDVNPIDGWVSIWGKVQYGDIPLCTMVLVNGQHMFSCRGEGRYGLYVPLNSEGKITILCFADGFATYNVTLSPAEAVNHDINMETASSDSNKITVTKDYVGPGVNNPDWTRLSGTVYYGEIPLCSMVLANGQHVFTCNEDANGEYDGKYDLEIPLDNDGNITLFGFVDGFLQYKETFKP